MLIRLVSVLLCISFLMEALADLWHLLFSLLLIGNFLYCVRVRHALLDGDSRIKVLSSSPKEPLIFLATRKTEFELIHFAQTRVSA